MPRRLVQLQHVSMGSSVQVSVWTDRQAEAGTAVAAVFAEFDRLDGLLSVWKQGSDVVRLNDAAGGSPVAVARDTIDVLTEAVDVGDLTAGKFDVTFGALSDVWRFDHDQDNRVPSSAEVAARVPRIDYRYLQLDRGAGTAFIRRAGTRVHLGGIGKGYAVDRAVAILRERGFRDFMIQSGGDLYVGGRKDDRPWRLGVQDPRGGGGDSFMSIDLSDATFSTSGDYERFFMKDGVRYHHLLDPDTGQPARGARSVTIVAPNAARADALSTGVFVMGPDAGMALIERLPDVEGVIVTSANAVLVSSGLADRVRQRHPPTDAP